MIRDVPVLFGKTEMHAICMAMPHITKQQAIHDQHSLSISWRAAYI